MKSACLLVLIISGISSLLLVACGESESKTPSPAGGGTAPGPEVRAGKPTVGDGSSGAKESDPAERGEAERDEARALQKKGAELFAKGEMQASGKACEAAVKLDPENQEAWVSKGLAHHASGEFAPALAAFDRALEIGPDRAPILLYRGLSLMGVGRHADAAESFARARALDPELKGPAVLEDRARKAVREHSGN